MNVLEGIWIELMVFLWQRSLFVQPSCCHTLCLCWFTGQPPCSNPAQTSSVPPGRQGPPAAPQVGVCHNSTAYSIWYVAVFYVVQQHLQAFLNTLLFLLFRFLSIPKGFSYLNERGYVSKQLDKWQKVQSGYWHICNPYSIFYFFYFMWRPIRLHTHRCFHLNAFLTAGIQPKVCGSDRGAAQRSTNNLPQTCWWRQLCQTQQPKVRKGGLWSPDDPQDTLQSAYLISLLVSPGYKDQMSISLCTCMVSWSTIRRAVIYWRLR